MDIHDFMTKYFKIWEFLEKKLGRGGKKESKKGIFNYFNYHGLHLFYLKNKLVSFTRRINRKILTF